MRLTVICPTHRGPAELLSVARMFAAQRHADRRLVIVENGPAVGVCRALGLVADAVLHSEHSKVAALNTGLAWLRRNGGGAWALWDDDDYYGPEYLSGVAAALPGHELVGKRSLYVRRNDGRLWLIERHGGWPLGHSFAGWSDCVDFHCRARWGEDDVFIRDMLAAGARLGDTGSGSFVWQRSGNLESHIWPATDDQVAQLLTWHDREHSRIVDYGADAETSMVDGNSACTGRLVRLPTFDPLDVPGIPESFRRQFRAAQAA